MTEMFSIDSHEQNVQTLIKKKMTGQTNDQSCMFDTYLIIISSSSLIGIASTPFGYS